MKLTHALRLLVSILLAALAVGLGGASFHRKAQSFQPLGFAAEVPGGSARVVAVTAEGTGLEPGDQILLVAGAEVTGEAGLAGRLRESPESRLTVLRGGELVEVVYRRPALDLDLPYLVLALTGVGYLLIGLFTLVRHGGRQGFLFYLWCLTSAALYLLTPVPPADRLFKAVFAVDELARLLLPALMLHLFLVFPERLFAGRRASLALPFLYLPGAFLATVQLDWAFLGGRLAGRPGAAAVAALDRLELGHLVLFALAAVAVLGWRLFSGRAWEQQRQLQWVAFGLAGGYLPFLLLHGLPWVLGLTAPELVNAAAVLPLALVPMAFAYAILRYKLWDIEVIVRDTISATTTLLLGIIGFSLVNLAIVRGVPQDLALARNLLSFGAGLAIAGLLVPTRRTISSTLERLQYRGSFGKRRALSGLGRELLLERDLGRLCAALLRRLEEGVEVERANLYLAQGDGLVAVRREAGLPGRLPGEAFEALDPSDGGFWGADHRRIAGTALPGEAATAAQSLFAAGYRYAFPLTVLGTRVGVALTGYKHEAAPLNSEDLELIRNLLNQAALAIENAQLLGQLHRRLEEVSHLQRYSEGIFESSPAGIVVLDEADRLVSANAAFAALLGEEPAALAGRPLAEVLPVGPLPTQGEPPVEVTFCEEDGRERCFQLSLSHFAEDSRGRLRILVVHDVSERVAMERALQEKDRLAALGMLAAGVAHEVNTPITGISSYAQMLLAETAENDPRYEILKKVERQTFRASRIVNNLLELARDRSGELRPVEVAPLLSESLDLLKDRLSKRRIAVDWTPPAEPVLVLGCDGELQQVFTNLLLNAVDAMADPAGPTPGGTGGGAAGSGGTLSLAVEADEARVRIEVRDTGPGIPADRLAKIFEPFYSTKLTRGGTGLGLSISYDIVHRHGGDLTVASRPGEGACFTVELPRHVAARV